MAHTNMHTLYIQLTPKEEEEKNMHRIVAQFTAIPFQQYTYTHEHWIILHLLRNWMQRKAVRERRKKWIPVKRTYARMQREKERSCEMRWNMCAVILAAIANTLHTYTHSNGWYPQIRGFRCAQPVIHACMQHSIANTCTQNKKKMQIFFSELLFFLLSVFVHLLCLLLVFII